MQIWRLTPLDDEEDKNGAQVQETFENSNKRKTPAGTKHDENPQTLQETQEEDQIFLITSPSVFSFVLSRHCRRTEKNDVNIFLPRESLQL